MKKKNIKTQHEPEIHRKYLNGKNRQPSASAFSPFGLKALLPGYTSRRYLSHQTTTLWFSQIMHSPLGLDFPRWCCLPFPTLTPPQRFFQTRIRFAHFIELCLLCPPPTFLLHAPPERGKILARGKKNFYGVRFFFAKCLGKQFFRQTLLFRLDFDFFSLRLILVRSEFSF